MKRIWQKFDFLAENTFFYYDKKDASTEKPKKIYPRRESSHSAGSFGFRGTKKIN